MTDTDALVVTQEDRVAATAYMRRIRDKRWSIEGILSGGCDNTSVVQAFARHRIAAEQRARSEGAKAGLEAAAKVADMVADNWGRWAGAIMRIDEVRQSEAFSTARAIASDIRALDPAAIAAAVEN